VGGSCGTTGVHGGSGSGADARGSMHGGGGGGSAARGGLPLAGTSGGGLPLASGRQLSTSQPISGGGDSATGAASTATFGGVVPARGPGRPPTSISPSTNANGLGASAPARPGRATKDELRRAMLEGWGRADDVIEKRAKVGGGNEQVEGEDEKEEDEGNTRSPPVLSPRTHPSEGAPADPAAPPAPAPAAPPAAEHAHARDARLAEFQRTMRERFLNGKDGVRIP
jgi:hypothetical protein